jgi:hypothetical protein
MLMAMLHVHAEEGGALLRPQRLHLPWQVGTQVLATAHVLAHVLAHVHTTACCSMRACALCKGGKAYNATRRLPAYSTTWHMLLPCLPCPSNNVAVVSSLREHMHRLGMSAAGCSQLACMHSCGSTCP